MSLNRNALLYLEDDDRWAYADSGKRVNRITSYQMCAINEVEVIII